MTIPKASEYIYCRHCDTPLYRITRDVHFDTPVSSTLFDPVPPMPELVDGTIPPPCPNGHQWFGEWINEPWSSLADPEDEISGEPYKQKIRPLTPEQRDEMLDRIDKLPQDNELADKLRRWWNGDR